MATADHAALVAPNNFKGSDLIIPILLDKPRKWSYVLIQVTNVEDRNLTDSLKSLALKALAPHGALKDLDSPFFGLCVVRGKKSSSATGAADVGTSKSPKRPIVVLLLRPANASAHPGMERQFIHDFRDYRRGLWSLAFNP